jgi:hypothetical protein
LEKITLVPRIYGQYRNRLLNTLQSEIEKMISELDLTSVVLDINKKDHFFVSVEGADSEFVLNLLAKEFGKCPSTYEILPEKAFRGQLVDVGKVGYGVYVDLGLSEPMIDALVPLHRLREQLDMQGVSLRKLTKSLMLVDNLPVDIVITEMDLENEEIGGEFAQSFLDRFHTWLHDDHERLFVFGANQDMIGTALERTGHADDIYQIEKLGYCEYVLQCKRSTHASGIIAAIGPRLHGVSMHLFIPDEIQAAIRGAKA